MEKSTTLVGFTKRLMAVLLAATVALSFGAVASAMMPQQAYAASTVSFKVSGTVDYEKSYEFLDILNKLRAKKGLGKLTMDKALLKAAEQRAAETSIIFAHTRTTGQSCATASKYIRGENIASGYPDADSVYEGWKSSTGHYKNMIKSTYKTAGVCCFIRNGETYWVNVFGTTKSSKAAKKTSTPTKTFKVKLAKKYLTKKNLYVEPNWMETDDIGEVVVWFWPSISGTECILPNSMFTFKSSNTSVLTVNKKGKLVSKKEGKAKLTVTVKGKTSCKATQTVKVEDYGGYYYIDDDYDDYDDYDW